MTSVSYTHLAHLRREDDMHGLVVSHFQAVRGNHAVETNKMCIRDSINMANNPSRLYKEVWIGLGGTQSAVYATEVSAEEYLAYTCLLYTSPLEQPFVTGGIANPDIFEFKPLAYVFFE